MLHKINEQLEQQSHEEWVQKIMEYKEKYPLTYHQDILTGPYIVEEIYLQTNGGGDCRHRREVPGKCGNP